MSTKPEMDIFDRIAMGLEPTPQAPAPVPQATPASPREQAIGYALSRHVPAMKSGFVVHTSYGPWNVSGDLAERMAQLMHNALVDELAKVERPE